MDTPVTKRLHIAGLAPSVTPDDLSARLSPFGRVQSVDGLPRQFAFVTLQTTVGKLAKCMSVLNGSTWKGAKLKLAEAKPDYPERLAAERAAQAALQPPRKRQKVDGVHAHDMSPVTPETAQTKAGWKVTEMGRVLSKVRMRPDRPLPPKLVEQSRLTAALKNRTESRSSSSRAEKKDRKRRKKDPPTRARRITIDVTKWGSTQLKGMFLGSQGMPTLGAPLVEEDALVSSSSSESSEGEHIVSSVAQPQELMDIALEKSNTLNLLSSIFAGEDDWIGKESVASDVDEEELLKHNRQSASYEADFELVPQEEEEQPTPEARSIPNLKDLFAPREEQAGFSLLRHLDLDLDLDLDMVEELQFAVNATAHTPPPTHLNRTAVAAAAAEPTTSVYINPREPLFFPSTDYRQKGAFEVVREAGWLWKDAPMSFYRTQTEDAVRAGWEEKRGELTRGWKRRAREAMKMGRRRRRSGAVAVDADVVES